MPEVSVLIPTFNRAHLVSTAVDSVLAQTHRSWELIVVDDGSTDDTAAVVARYGDRVRYIRQDNQGVSVARNRALRESTGQFVVFLDSDDWLLPTAIQSLVEAFSRYPEAEVIFSNGFVVDEHGNRSAELIDEARVPATDSLDDFVVDPPVGIHSTMVRRSALQLLDGPFDELMWGYEDTDLFLRLKAEGCHFCYIPHHTYCYHIHGDNKSAPKSSMAERRRLSLLRNREKVINSDWFDSLSLETHQAFFHDLLTHVLKADTARQPKILVHPAFHALPAIHRSRLLYYMAVENALAKAEWAHDIPTLMRAIRLRPSDPRPYALAALCILPVPLRQAVLRAWRRLHATAVSEDPVTKILRRKGMA